MSHPAHGHLAPRILLIGLDEDLVSEILRTLPECDVRAAPAASLDSGKAAEGCDVIFCPAGFGHLLPVLKKAPLNACPSLP